MIYPLQNWKTAKRGYKFGEKTFYSLHHLGVDVIVPEGTPVLASCDSEIIFSASRPQGGNTIWVRFIDPELKTLIMRCMHLVALKPKGKYKEGQIIGYTGNTGEYSRGPHFHVDISKEKVLIKNFDNFIDPEKYFFDHIKK